MKKVFIAVLLLVGFNSHAQTENAPKLATHQKGNTNNIGNNTVQKKAPVLASGQMSNDSSNGKQATKNKSVLAGGTRKPKGIKDTNQK